MKTKMIHPCNCKEYNGGQCYNCLNGAHEFCGKCKRKTNDRSLGLTIVIKGIILVIIMSSFSGIGFERSYDKKIIQHINSRRVELHRLLVVHKVSEFYQGKADSLALASYRAMESSIISTTQGADTYLTAKYDSIMEPAHEKFNGAVNSEVGFSYTLDGIIEKIDEGFDENGRDGIFSRYVDDTIVVSVYAGNIGYTYTIFVWPGR